MEEYRKEAQNKYKYEQDRIKKELHEREQQEPSTKCEQYEREQHEIKHEFNEQWMVWTTLLEEDTLHSLHALTTLVETIPMEQDYIHERMVELVEQLNTIQETRTVDAVEARFIHEAVSKLVQLTKIDIEIHAMDTSQDEDYARNVEQIDIETHTMYTSQDEDYARNVEQIELEQYQDVSERLDQPLQLCSIDKRIGLTVLQMRDIARLYNIKITGNKRELCLALAHYGLVRLV